MADEFQPVGKFKPVKELLIKDVDTLKAVSDPMRLQILEHMLEGPRTVKQLAQELDMPPTKLYYHMNLLEQHGIVRVTGTRVVSGIIEKQYQVTAYSISVDKTLLPAAGSKMDDARAGLLGNVMDRTRSEITRSMETGLIKIDAQDDTHSNFVMLRSLSRLTEERALAFAARLREVITEFSDANDSEASPDARVYGMLLAFYPTTRTSLPAAFHEGEAEEEQPAGEPATEEAPAHPAPKQQPAQKQAIPHATQKTDKKKDKKKEKKREKGDSSVQ